MLPFEQYQGFGHHVWIYFFYFFIFVGYVGQGCSPCRCTFKVRGCPNSFWDHFAMFCLETFLSTLLSPPPPSPLRSFCSSLHSLTQPICNFLPNFWTHALWIVHMPPWCANRLLSPFLMKVSNSFPQSSLGAVTLTHTITSVTSV
jgi:hypothetical protein